jgi:hypothetical protein
MFVTMTDQSGSMLFAHRCSIFTPAGWIWSFLNDSLEARDAAKYPRTSNRFETMLPTKLPFTT